MHIFTDIIVGILMGYLALTNTLANGLSNWFDLEVTPEVTQTTQTASLGNEPTLTTLPSVFAAIPQILRESAKYQAAAVITSSTSTPPSTTVDPENALVNIYCTFTTNDSIRTTTGTGFFVSEEGVILTNAHVAQFLLLDTTDVLGEAKCQIRNGSPAAPRYTAELLYIPPAWIAEHAALIDDAAPSGTGERDYALLYVNDTIDGSPLPASFPALPVAPELLRINRVDTTVTAAGYPAGDRSRSTATDLTTHKATTTISELFTFDSNYADVMALRGSSMGQQGASGGPVVDEEGFVIGMITTRGDDSNDGAGSLRAITLSHINRTIEEETGIPFLQHLNGNIKNKADIFTETIAPFLTSILTSEIEQS